MSWAPFGKKRSITPIRGFFSNEKVPDKILGDDWYTFPNRGILNSIMLLLIQITYAGSGSTGPG